MPAHRGARRLVGRGQGARRSHPARRRSSRCATGACVRLRPRVDRRARREARLPSRPPAQGRPGSRAPSATAGWSCTRSPTAAAHLLAAVSRTTRRPPDGRRDDHPRPLRDRWPAACSCSRGCRSRWMTIEGAVAIARRHRRGLDRARRLRVGLGDRGLRQRHHHLALHRRRASSPTPPRSAPSGSSPCSSSCSRRTSASNRCKALVDGRARRRRAGSASPWPWARSSSCRHSPSPSSASPTSSDRPRPPGEGRQNMLCAVPRRRAAARACWATRCSAPGGSTRRSGLLIAVVAVKRRAPRRGAARGAA